ncbi:unnamed protein product [Pneumocystis jirovecii]|uniref:Uncharacterized protein n=1 Tax=Pneumocystis jirovecii TaxID=42068 RepID=L0PC05_PNEJI|nr:unnamed protein product [Pneumocystis jirovecii]
MLSCCVGPTSSSSEFISSINESALSFSIFSLKWIFLNLYSEFSLNILVCHFSTLFCMSFT